MKLASFTGTAVSFPRNIYETSLDSISRGFDRCWAFPTWESMNFRDYRRCEKNCHRDFSVCCLIHLKSKLQVQRFNCNFFFFFINLHPRIHLTVVEEFYEICSYFSSSIKILQFYEISREIIFHLAVNESFLFFQITGKFLLSAYSGI